MEENKDNNPIEVKHDKEHCHIIGCGVCDETARGLLTVYNPIEEKIAELVRDLTMVAPRPKSDVRRRLNELYAQARREVVEECVEAVKEGIDSADESAIAEAVAALEKLKDEPNDFFKNLK